MDARFTHRIVPAGAPIEVPPNAVSSPFSMARVYLGSRVNSDQGEPTAATAPDAACDRPGPEDTTPSNQQQEESVQPEVTKRRGRAPGIPRARQVLKSCGPLTVAQLAEGLGVDQAKASDIATAGTTAGHWTSEVIDGEAKLVLVAGGPKAAKKTGDSGLKRWLKKPPQTDVKPRRAAKKAKTKATPVRARKAQPAALPAPVAASRVIPEKWPAPPNQSGAKFGLFNTGEFRIEHAGQGMTLPEPVFREMVTYLDKLATTRARP